LVPSLQHQHHNFSSVPTMTAPAIPKTQEEWKNAMKEMPDVPPGGKIPAFFLAHGCQFQDPYTLAFPVTHITAFTTAPSLIYPEELIKGLPPVRAEKISAMGPHGDLATFLRDFGPWVLEKYKPRAVVVLSAHWETPHTRLVTDYGDQNPLLMDYFGFPREVG
jgi:hypothetical protein